MSSFWEVFSAKGLSVAHSSYHLQYGRLVYSLLDMTSAMYIYLNALHLGKYVTSGRIYWLKTSLPCYIYITFYYNIYIYISIR